MPTFWRGFRTRLGVLLIASLIPGIILNVALTQSLRDAKEDEIIAQTEVLAKAIGAIQETRIDDTEVLLSRLAHDPIILGLPESGLESCTELLAELLIDQPSYNNFGVFDAGGFGVCNARGAAPGRDNSDRAYYLETVRLDGFAAGDYQIGRTTGVPGINFGYPIHDAVGELIGIVFPALPVTSLGELISNRLVPDKTTVTVADNEGTVLIQVPETEGVIGDTSVLQTAIAAHMSGESELLIKDFATEGIEDFVTVAEVALAPGQAPGFVVLSSPASVAFGGVNATTRSATAAIVVVVAVVLAVALFGLEILAIRPVKTLIRAANSLAAGDLSYRTGLSHSSGELGQLAGSFDAMADSVEESARRAGAAEKSLDNARERAETLARIGRIVSSSPDVGEVFEAVGDEIRKLIPVDRLVLSKVKGDPPVATDLAIFGIQIPNRPVGTTTPIDRTQWDAAVKSGDAMVFDHTNIESYFPGRDVETEDEIYKSLKSHLVVPLVARGELAGAISFRSLELEGYSETEIEVAKEISAQISGAVANAELRRNLEEESARRDLLARIGRSITSAPSIEETYPKLVSELQNVIPFDRMRFLPWTWSAVCSVISILAERSPWSETAPANIQSPHLP